MDSVLLLTEHGIPLDYILDDCPLSVFQELVLITYKRNLQQQQQDGFVMMAAVGALFSKKGGDTLQDFVEKQINKIDSLLDLDAVEEEEEYEYVKVPSNGGFRKRKSKEADPKRVKAMLERFHANFARLTGQAVPPLDLAIKKAQAFQKAHMIRTQQHPE